MIYHKYNISQTQQPMICWDIQAVHHMLSVVLDILVTSLATILMLGHDFVVQYQQVMRIIFILICAPGYLMAFENCVVALKVLMIV